MSHDSCDSLEPFCSALALIILRRLSLSLSLVMLYGAKCENRNYRPIANEKERYMLYTCIDLVKKSLSHAKQASFSLLCIHRRAARPLSYFAVAAVIAPRRYKFYFIISVRERAVKIISSAAPRAAELFVFFCAAMQQQLYIAFKVARARSRELPRLSLSLSRKIATAAAAGARNLCRRKESLVLSGSL